jgi:hypothetical protein
MKRRVQLLSLLSVVVALLLYGCGGGTNPPAATNTPVTANATATTASANPTNTTAAQTAPTNTAEVVSPANTNTPGGSGSVTDTPAEAAEQPTATMVPAPTMIVALATAPTVAQVTETPVAQPAASTFTQAPGASEDAAVAVTAPVTITEKFATADATQYFKLDLSKTAGGAVQATFKSPKGAEGYLKFGLYDANGNDVDTKNVSPGTTEELISTVKPGVYTVQVTGDTALTNAYNLSVIFHPNAPNADKDTAAKLPLSANVTTYLNSTEDVHWYALDMSKYPQGGLLNVSLKMPSEATGYGKIMIKDPQGADDIDSKNVASNSSDVVQTEVDKATNYFIVMQAADGYDWTQPVTLNATFTPHLPYGTPESSQPITMPVQLKVQLSTPNDAAYFKFNLDKAGTVTATVDNPADGGYVRVEVLDSTGQNVFDGGTVNFGETKGMDIGLPKAGTYLLRVKQTDSNPSKSPVSVDLRPAPANP